MASSTTRMRRLAAPGFERCAAEVGVVDVVGDGYQLALDRGEWSKIDQVNTSG